MICKKCNHKLPDDSEFCQYCGTKIESVEATPKNALDAMLQFQATATIDAMRANSASQPDNEEQDDFGLVPQKPIYTLALKSVIGEKEYLGKLRTEDGQEIRYTRRGSTSVDGIHGMIDIYDTFLPDGQPYKTIYINMYGAKASTAAPSGFSFASATVPRTDSKPQVDVEEITTPTSAIDFQTDDSPTPPWKTFVKSKKMWGIIGTAGALILAFIILIPAVFIPNRDYKEACVKLRMGYHEAAIEMFEELDGYKDSEEKIKEAKYEYVLDHKNNDDLTTFEYLKELKKQDYKDSLNIYNDLYKWRISGKIHTDREYSDNHETTVSKYCTYFACNLKITGGTPGEKIDVTHTTVYPDGDTYVSDWHWYDVADNHTFGVHWENGIYTNPQNGATGMFHIKVYNVSTGELLGTISTRIVN